MVRKSKLWVYILVLIIAIAIVIAIIFGIYLTKNISYASDSQNKTVAVEIPITPQDKSKKINIEEIVENNTKVQKIEVLEEQEIDVEFTTQYIENSSLAKGKIQVLQEGVDGKQNAVLKNVYEGDELISSVQVSSRITKASVDKIVQVGTAAFSNNYVPVVGDELKATSTTLAIRLNPDENSDKVVTINKGDKVLLKAKQGDWYYVSYDNYLGWAKADSLEYVDPNGTGDGDENNVQYTKEQLTQNLGFSMLLNKPSGLTLDQFKQIFENDSNDVNNIFKDNAEYFYYIEQQYNINGIFVAAVGIHESAWGTSNISKNKKNLFGYGAYDSDPSGSAYTFQSYAEGIDLVARVFVKYYLNPAGTPIYGGETATGTYFEGATLTAVNTRYASDKNWANAVYKWMTYLYNKL